ncbi:MAG: methionine synthase, partial [Chloroflexota bacterium]
GSMPHTDPVKACDLITRFLIDIPAWPQLPRRSYKEGMAVQFSQGFPCIVEKDNSVYVDRSIDIDKPLEALYTAYLDNDADKYPVGAEYAAGLYELVARTDLQPQAVKGQITGPISWGLSVTDDTKRAVLYDIILADAAAKLLHLKAGWQEKMLGRLSEKTITFIDEPSMASYGSAFFSLPKENVISLLEEVLGGIRGISGIHCCGNTDWSLILGTSTDVLSFDAYNYAENFCLYPSEVKEFLNRGGAVAWGIVPNTEESINKETVASLKDRLEEAISPFTRHAIPFRQLIEQGLITPSCSLSYISEDAAGRTLELLADLSKEIRRRYT